MQTGQVGPAEIISASAIVAGFGVTALMFRVQRELYVLEVLKIKVLWLAWADYLILASVFVAVFGATVPLLAVPNTSRQVVAAGASSCVSALCLLAGYVPSILAHYRIQLGAERSGPRHRGEPVERRVVMATALFSGLAFAATMFFWLR